MEAQSADRSDQADQADQPGNGLVVEVLGRLDHDQQTAVRELVAAATEADGVHPLSEHVVLHLRYGGDAPGRNVLVRTSGGDLAGYAHLDPTDLVEGPSAETVVDPRHRGHGVGRRLVRTLEDLSPDGRLRLWAHGQVPGARALATSMGYARVRELWQMRRSLLSALPDVPLPEGVSLRAFRPGEDDEEWVWVNAAAFVDHPEQGGWTLEDLHRRMSEDWFDPDGFLVAEEDGRMVGFHWTKVHGGDHVHGQAEDVPHAHEGHGHEAIGEVYVVGVAPGQQGRGLGKALTVAGLRHLRSAGLPQAMLYVDADNTAAIRTYTSLGFTRWDVDAMFSRETPEGAAAGPPAVAPSLT